MKTLYSSGRSDSSTTGNKAIPLNPKIKSDVVKVCSKLKKKTEFLRLKKNEDEKSQAREIDGCKSFAKRTLQTQKQASLPVKVAENPPSLKSVRDKTCKSIHENPRSGRPLHTKKQLLVKVSGDPKYCPALKKNSSEMLELFDIAKKSADVANAKGLLTANAETSICVDTLTLLVSFPVSSTDPGTRRIMEKLERLTKHKDRKICNSASQLLNHWRQSIRDQQRQQDS
ncbi:unnamed protein product [Arabis nemorensis]|nr:unnamed protein product [Arabis nemorensis]